MGIWNRIRLFGLFIRLVFNPNRTELIFKAVKIASHDPGNPVVKMMEEKLMADPAFRQLYESHYVPRVPAMEELAKLPERSFGNLLYHHLKDNNLDLNLFPSLECDSPIDYMSFKIYQDHDLWHVLLNCDVSIEDEIEIQAFGVAQYQSPISTLLVAGGLLHLLMRDPMRAVAAMKKAVDGYTLGKQAVFLPNLRLHEMFALPIGEVRAVCQLPV
jgi:ubiquinone biosynthesis protein Coq4